MYLRSLARAVIAISLTMKATSSFAQASVPSSPPAAMLGTAWYPEQWPESRWESDLALMQQAHLHVVRVGEFAWSTEEPSEGRFHLIDESYAATLLNRDRNRP